MTCTNGHDSSTQRLHTHHYPSRCANSPVEIHPGHGNPHSAVRRSPEASLASRGMDAQIDFELRCHGLWRRRKSVGVPRGQANRQGVAAHAPGKNRAVNWVAQDRRIASQTRGRGIRSRPMSSDPSGPQSPTSTEPPQTSVAMTWLAIVLGTAIAATGVILGLARALQKIEAECQDGTEFPAGETDFRCFVHPHVFEGSALVLVSLMLAILIGLTGLIAKNLLSRASLNARR